jgi:hypothetical protein
MKLTDFILRFTSSMLLIFAVIIGGIWMRVALVIFIACMFAFTELVGYLFRKNNMI